MRAWIIGALLGLSMALALSHAGAQEAPISVLDHPYPSTHAPSIFAECDGPEAIRVGIHPIDQVARSFRVEDDAGRFLINVASASFSTVIPLAEHPTRLVYNGDQTWQLITSRCAVPLSLPPITDAPSSTVAPSSTSQGPAPTLLAAEAAPEPPTSVVATVVVLVPAEPAEGDQVATSGQRIIPVTGASVENLIVLVGILVAGGTVAVVVGWRR